MTATEGLCFGCEGGTPTYGDGPPGYRQIDVIERTSGPMLAFFGCPPCIAGNVRKVADMLRALERRTARRSS